MNNVNGKQLPGSGNFGQEANLRNQAANLQQRGVQVQSGAVIEQRQPNMQGRNVQQVPLSQQNDQHVRTRQVQRETPLSQQNGQRPTGY